MPRAPRITPAGFVFHVLNRATEGLTLFRNRSEYQQFYRLLRAGVARIPMRIIAYCLMPTHWHLVLWPLTDGAVSSYLHWLTTKHSLRFRSQTHSVGRGHVYQERFHSFPVETSRYYFKLLRYVEANPLKGGLVTRAEQWPWSSLTERMGDPKVITDGPLPLPSDWLEWVNVQPPKSELDMLRRSVRTGRPFGSRRWVLETAVSQGLVHTLRGRGRPGRSDPF